MIYLTTLSIKFCLSFTSNRQSRLVCFLSDGDSRGLLLPVTNLIATVQNLWISLGSTPLPSLNYADNHVRRPSSDDLERNLKETPNLINMFRGLHDSQFVRISSETIEVLNLVPGLQARQTDLPLQKIEVFESAWRG